MKIKFIQNNTRGKILRKKRTFKPIVDCSAAAKKEYTRIVGLAAKRRIQAN